MHDSPLALRLPIGAGLVGGLAATVEYAPRAMLTVAPLPPVVERCLDPLEDFGTDTPRLRLFLQAALPDACFTYRWRPAVDLLDAYRRSGDNRAPSPWRGPSLSAAPAPAEVGL